MNGFIWGTRNSHGISLLQGSDRFGRLDRIVAIATQDINDTEWFVFAMILNTQIHKNWTRHSTVTKWFPINRLNQNGISEGPSWQQVSVCKCITNEWRLSSTINEGMSTDWSLIWEFKGNWDNWMWGNCWRWNGIGTGIEWDGNGCPGQLHRM